MVRGQHAEGRLQPALYLLQKNVQNFVILLVYIE